MRMMKRRAPSGFTLMELLIVVIIIGILATLALPQFTRFVDQSREAEATNAASATLSAEFLYFQEKSDFTTDPNSLAVEVPTLKYWNPLTFSFTEADGAFSGLTGEKVIVTITSKNHPGHASDTHVVKGGIDEKGVKVIAVKRPPKTVFEAL